MANTTRSPLEFFGETIAAAGGKFAGEKYTHALDDIFSAAASDPEI